MILLVTLLIEVNRAPFDIVEGESELVSGYNSEYSGVLLTLIFLSEYGMLLVLLLIVCMLLSSSMIRLVICSVLSLFMLVLRTLYPRIRYDYMMSLLWNHYLPVTLVCLVEVLVYLVGVS